ncbi:hypothetical protein FHS95_003716 [Sphingomonas naasensis]|uniref:Uncharacterized protein n=1 Tax=Sphingomonas naasensis TaxID=1344951 RepID=A0A4S1WMG8_9SPHN|nr:hypothetical protein [Sphingomonas naasensis]NIJ22005.1 hypothetical protein [Sphingomonas naasensis]TGX42316.1 hypothetical protein E5A74_10715 [Sphingomonas naasensis]
MAAILIASATFAATPADACSPPVTGVPRIAPPGDAVIAESLFRQSSEIVYGRVIRGAGTRGGARFKVLHVYKGKLKPGAILAIAWTAPMPCAGVTVPQINKGMSGVIGFSGAPKLDFIERKWVDRMIADKWIVASPGDRARLQRVGTGSAPE